jgi:hypothetical protein
VKYPDIKVDTVKTIILGKTPVRSLAHRGDNLSGRDGDPMPHAHSCDPVPEEHGVGFASGRAVRGVRSVKGDIIRLICYLVLSVGGDRDHPPHCSRLQGRPDGLV